MVAEGGNLGFTQRGRIEAALAGVRLNTDAIDNSAGVDTSDHEVNIKILLGLAISDGEMTEKQRNALLRADDRRRRRAGAARQLLPDAGAVGRRAASVATLLDQQARFMRFLEKTGHLNRAIEFLPTEDEIAERKARGAGLTTPERAVLLRLQQDVAVRRADGLRPAGGPVDRHRAGSATSRRCCARSSAPTSRAIRCKREIIATHVLNSMVNRVGSTFVHRLAERTGATPAQVVRAYLAAREVFGDVAALAADRGARQQGARRRAVARC